MRKWGPLPALILLLWCSSCATLPLAPPPPSPEELLSQIRERFQAFQGVKGLAHVSFSAPGKSFRAQEVILARRPGYLRVESLSPLGNPQFYLVTDGRELTLYNPGENHYYRGPATTRHLSPFLPAALEPEEVVTLLLGGCPILPHEDAAVRFDAQEGLWILDLSAPPHGEGQRIGVHPQTGQVLHTEYRRQGVTRRLSFTDFRSAPTRFFPYKIHFASPESRTQFTVEYTDVETNPVWEDSDFHLPVPRGARIIPLE